MSIRDKAKAAAMTVDEVVGAAFDDDGRLHVYEEVNSPRVQKSVREAVGLVSKDIEVLNETKAVGPNPKSKLARAAKSAAEAVEGVVGTALVFGSMYVYLEIDSAKLREDIRNAVQKVTNEIDLRFYVTGPLEPDIPSQLAKAAKLVQHLEGVRGVDVHSEVGKLTLFVYVSADDERLRADVMIKVWGVAPKAVVAFVVTDPESTTARLLQAREAILAIEGVVDCKITTDKPVVTLKEDDPRIKDQVLDIVSVLVPGAEVQFVVPPQVR